MTIQNIAILSGGVSGVSAAIHLKKAGLNITLFERGTKTGGVWIYNPRSAIEPIYPCTKPSTGDSPDFEKHLQNNNARKRRDSPVEFENDGDLTLLHAPPGPAYEGLTNNVSTPEMKLKSQQWKPGTEDFVKHNILAEYIQDAAVNNGIENDIEFQTRVNHVEKEGEVWKVHVSKLIHQGGKYDVASSIRTFDAVVVASGHYHAPNIPAYPGLAALKQRFPAQIQHSKGYRSPTSFADKTVLLIGAGVSSTDIARELGPVAKKIYQSSRGGEYDLTAGLLPENGERIGAIASFEFDGNEYAESEGTLPVTVRLTSGEQIRGLDHIILATGYHMSYPFLRALHADDVAPADASPTTLVTSGQVTHNLHKDIFYIPDPTLAFIGVPYHVATFSLFEFQAIALAAVYSGSASLPTQQQMREEYNERLRTKGVGRAFHSLKDDEGEIKYVEEMMAIVNQNRSDEEKVEGHTKKWLEAYQRRLLRLERLRGPKNDGGQTGDRGVLLDVKSFGRTEENIEPRAIDGGVLRSGHQVEEQAVIA